MPDDTYPSWAIDLAAGLLNIGEKAPAIEARLVERGLSPPAAAAVVDGILAGRVRGELRAQARGDHIKLLFRALSLLLAAGLVIAAYFLGGSMLAVRIAIPIFPAVALVWFGDELGAYTGWWHVNRPVAGVVLRWVACIVLLAVGLVLVYLAVAPE